MTEAEGQAEQEAGRPAMPAEALRFCVAPMMDGTDVRLFALGNDRSTAVML